MLTIVLGFFLCFALLYVALRGQNLGIVREFRSKLKGYSDVLVYAALVDDGIVLNKDGALLAAWEYRGNDLDSAGATELDVLSERVNAALCRRGAGWMMHVDAIRYPVSRYPAACAFPDRTTSLIDHERRLQSETEDAHFDTRYVLVLTYLPPSDREDKLTDFLVEGDKVRDDTSSARALRSFNDALRDVENTLSSSLRLKRLKTRTETDAIGNAYDVDELLTHLSACVTAVDHPVRRPKVPMYLDAVLGSVDFFGGLKPRVGDRHVRTIAITGFPSESYPGVLESLNRLAMSYRWSTRFIFLDAPDARKRLDAYRKRWFVGRQSMRSLLASQMGGGAQPLNNEALRMAADAQGAVDDLAADVVRFGFYTSAIVVAEDDAASADERAREVLKLLFNLGFNARIEEVNAVEAFLGTHPGNGYANVRKPLMHTKNVADFLPLTAVWAGAETNPCPFYPPASPPLAETATSGATPFRLNLHVGDVGHTLVLGPSGSGKSTLLSFLAASHFRYPNAQTFVFDKGYSLYALVKAAGGRHYDIMGDLDTLSFCPLQHVDEPSERAWACGWIETLAELQGVRVTPHHRRVIAHALTLLGQSESRTMTDLLSGPLQDDELRTALDRYTLDGPWGSLLDSRRDALRDDPFTVFELEHLMDRGGGGKHVVPVLLYLFHRLEKRLDGRPTLIVLDEAWTLIDNPLFAEQIRDWLKTLRKKNAAVVFATQSVADVLDKPITSAILESCPTKIFLPNPEARSEASSAAYKKIGLSDRQIHILAAAVPKRHYYYTSPLGQRLFDLGLGPIAVSFLGASGKDDIAAVRALADTFGAYDWPAEWLWQRGLRAAAAHWLDADDPQRAHDLMARYRDTWPAELLRANGRDAEAERWLDAYAPAATAAR